MLEHSRSAPTGGRAEKIIDRRSGARSGSTAVVLLLLAAGYALTVLVFQPGYMTVDARYVYDDGRAFTLNDWQSPVMSVLWRLIDPIAPGAWSMFLLIATLYWLGLRLLALTVARRGPRPGIAAPLCRARPPGL